MTSPSSVVVALALLLSVAACTDEAPITTESSVFIYSTELRISADRVQWLFVVDDDPGEEAARLRSFVANTFRESLRLRATLRNPGAGWKPVDVEAVIVRPSGNVPHATSVRMTWRTANADATGAESFAAAVESELGRSVPAEGGYAPLEAAWHAWRELAVPAPERKTMLIVASTRDDESPLPTAAYAVSSDDGTTWATTDTHLVAAGESSDETCRFIMAFDKPATPAGTRLEAWRRASRAAGLSWPCTPAPGLEFWESTFTESHRIPLQFPETPERCRVFVDVADVCLAERGWRAMHLANQQWPLDGRPLRGRACEVSASCAPGTSGYCLVGREMRFLGGALPSPGSLGVSCELQR